MEIPPEAILPEATPSTVVQFETAQFETAQFETAPSTAAPSTAARSDSARSDSLATAALLALPGGLLVFDAAATLSLINPPALELLGLAGQAPPPGTSLAAFASRCAALRDGADAAALAAALVPGDGTPRHLAASRDPWLELRGIALPQGGWVVLVSAAAQAPSGELADLALRHHHSGIALYDAEHRLRLFNPAYERVLGLAPGSRLRTGVHFHTLLEHVMKHQLPGDGSQALVRVRSEVDRSKPAEFIRTRADGRTYRTISRPVPGGGFLISIDEITLLRKAQEEASRRAALLDGVLRAMPYGICVFDAGHRLTMVNDAYQRIMAGVELTIGSHLMTICRERLAGGEYFDGDTAESVFARQFQFDQPPRERLRHNGTAIITCAAALPDGGHISVISDITALHRVRAEARDRARLLQVMLDSMRHGVCLFDNQHRVVAANALAAAMTGLRPEELVPGAPLQMLRRLQRERGEFGTGPDVDLVFTDHAGMEVVQRDSYLRTRSDGTVIGVTTDPTPDGGYVRTYADVTEERRASEATERARIAAEQANAAKTHFLATMSHELRTPLNAVIGFSEALVAEPETPDAREFAETILQAGRHLLSLIDEILEVAKAGAEDFHVETRALLLPSVLEGAIRIVRGAAEAARVSLKLLPSPPDLPRGLGEERRLRQVLLSLLSNAVKFTPAGGHIQVSATAMPGGGVEIVVADTGIGMPPEQLPLAFEPFTQLETNHARSYGGSGLGLYLARTLARAMGAELILESLQGQGTVARLRLAPATPQQEQTA